MIIIIFNVMMLSGGPNINISFPMYLLEMRQYHISLIERKHQEIKLIRENRVMEHTQLFKSLSFIELRGRISLQRFS